MTRSGAERSQNDGRRGPTRPRSRLKRVALGVFFALAALAAAFWFVYGGGKLEGRGVIVGRKAAPAESVALRKARQVEAQKSFGRNERSAKQILFGDLHVHTTFSMDAFFRSLPMLGGEGAHPPADACDFARHCSQLDFFSFNDHAEALPPELWEETKESVRQCNALAGDPTNPDLVVFAGWEWSHVGQTIEEHYGHKNVIFRDTDDARLPKRPIAAPGFVRQGLQGQNVPIGRALAVPLVDFSRRQRYLDLQKLRATARDVPACPRGVDVRELPERCHEEAATPAELFEKLAQWGFPHLVIPHGTSWGLYTPPGYVYDKQLARAQQSPVQRLIEIHSGHGNSEEYRSWRAAHVDDEGQLSCPEPSEGYEPCCWRAGELIRARCGDIPEADCEARVRRARQLHLEAGLSAYLVVPGAETADWGECGSCTDCFNGCFNHRPGGSAQYILARGNFDDPSQPSHASMGFIASSDNHTARPGTGYKEFARRKMTEAQGPESAEWRERLAGTELPRPKSPEPDRVTPTILNDRGVGGWAIANFERQASFFLTGGLVAVHSRGRSREAIWDALQGREVYATSGDRILLWFDLVNAPAGVRPMGSDVRLGVAPRFRVRAVGAFKQLPGCPSWSVSGLGQERIDKLCAGECYHPSDERRLITRIEVVRIRPQIRDGEPIEELIEDVWKRFDCKPNPGGCRVEIEDPTFVEGRRDAIYYVRAIQEPSLAVNADSLRCRREENGRCVETAPCYGDYRTPASDDCLAENEERAWSSPIFVRFDAALARASAADAGADAADQK